MSRPGSATLARFTDMPVIESPFAPHDHVILTGQNIIVADVWRQLSWPLFLAEQRRIGRDHLRRVVLASAQRLGLSASRGDGQQ